MKKAEKLACRLMAWQIETYRRSARKLPQSAIAERLQVDLDEYRRIEAGEVRITLDLLLRLQVALNAPTEYLWFPFASTIEDASEATVLRVLKNACVIFGDEGGSSDEG